MTQIIEVGDYPAFERPLSRDAFFVKSAGIRQNGNCPRPAQAEFYHFAEAPLTYKKRMLTAARKRDNCLTIMDKR